MATVSTIVELFGVSKHTVRAWSREFAPFLGPGATPTRGERRIYNQEDLGVFALIAHLRAQNASYAEIHDALQSGQRIEIQPATGLALRGPGTGPAFAPSPEFAPVEVFQLFAEKLTQQYQEQIQELRHEIDRVGRERDYFREQWEALNRELREERERVLTAEKTVARQETELSAMANQGQLLHEERTARINAVNKLAAAQARAERAEQQLEALSRDDKRGGGLLGRR